MTSSFALIPQFYGVADSHLFSALRVIAEREAGAPGANGMQGKNVAVISIGTSTEESSAAWYEAVCLAWGSQACTSFRPCASKGASVRPAAVGGGSLEV